MNENKANKLGENVESCNRSITNFVTNFLMVHINNPVYLVMVSSSKKVTIIETDNNKMQYKKIYIRYISSVIKDSSRQPTYIVSTRANFLKASFHISKESKMGQA